MVTQVGQSSGLSSEDGGIEPEIVVSSHAYAGREILLATDFSESSWRALGVARQVARMRGAAVHAIHIIDLTDSSRAGPLSFSSARDAAQRGLRQIQRDLRLAGVPGSATLITGGSVADAIHKSALRYQPCMVVLGLHGQRTMPAATPGETAKMILAHAPYPVAIVGDHVQANPTSPFARVLFVTDSAPESLRGAGEDWPNRNDPKSATLHIVLPPETARQTHSSQPHDERFASVRQFDYESAAEAALREAESSQADIVVLRIRAKSYLDSFAAGSIAHQVITRALCPVLTVRA